MASDEIDERYKMENYVSTLADDTDEEWAYILTLCERKYPIGFGELDSFLSGPDLGKRVFIVEQAVKSNEWLRLELLDTLSLNQSQDWSEEQIHRLALVAGQKEAFGRS